MGKRTQTHISRRQFVGAMAVTPMIRSASGRGRRSSGSRTRIAVIGAGAFGAWTALHLNRLGAEVVLVDGWGAGNSRSSSGGEGRALRTIYGPDRVYSEMARRSLELWRDLELQIDRRIYTETGALWMVQDDATYVNEAVPILEEFGLRVDSVSIADARSRYPQIDFQDVDAVFFEHRAGVLRARESCQWIVELFESNDGVFERAIVPPLTDLDSPVKSLPLEDGRSLEADRFVLACGPWLGAMVPDLLTDLIRPTRQEVFYFGTPPGNDLWMPERLPIWIELAEQVVYGFPDSMGRGFKFADDPRGRPIDPSSADRRPTPELIAAARRYLEKRFPALADSPLLETRVCQYENSPDGHLIIDRHPTARNIWIAGGGSGHGFKLAPAVGEMLAGAILDDRALDPKFSLARLSATDDTKTQFESQGDSE